MNIKEKKQRKKRKKEPVRKAKYGTLKCVKWLVSRMWQWDKRLFMLAVLLLPVTVSLYAIGLYMPSIILKKLQVESQFQKIMLVIIALICANYMFEYFRDLLFSLRKNVERRNSMRFYWELTKVDSQKDYFLCHDEDYQKIHQRAYRVLGGGADGSPGHYVIQFFDMLANALCFVLFGSIIANINIFILFLLVIGSLIILIPQRKQQDKDYEEQDERNANAKKLSYLSWTLPMILRAGKDIRIYNFVPFLEKKISNVIDEHIRLLKRQQKHRDLAVYVNFAVGFLRDGLAYIFLIHGVVEGKYSPAEFVLYFNAIAQISGFIDGIIQYFGTAHEVMLGISDCIVYFDEPRNRMNHGKGISITKGKAFSVEFRNVSYKYPKGEKNILENVSFRIEAGEKISLVGLNGAGKTTLTKLMCGLLIPDKGEILINEHRLQDYNRNELYSLFSIVPQDYSILPTSIAENIAFCDKKNIDEKHLWNCLENAGIADKIRALPRGIDSGMDQQYEEGAVHFSGGETQKLLLARALYHMSSILILDEPTAALDPIAEDDMYQKYSMLTQNVTSIFISHRLASTRFCDRIYLLEGARLTESGTHNELIAQGGRYRELFDVQSQYYKEGGDISEG